MSLAVTTFAHGGHTNIATVNTTTGAFTAVAGNLIVVAVQMYNPTTANISALTVTDNGVGGSNTYTLIGTSPAVVTGSDATCNVWFYYANVVHVNGASFAVNAAVGASGQAYVQVAAWQISGAACGESAINTFQIGGGASGGSTNTTAPMTTTNAKTIICAMAATLFLGTTYTQGAGYTLDLTEGDDTVSGCQHIVNTTIQTGVVPTMTNNSTGSVSWQMMAVAIAGASSGGSGGGSGLCLAMDASVRNSGLRH